MPQYAGSEIVIVNKDAIDTDKLLIKKLWTRKSTQKLRGHVTTGDSVLDVGFYGLPQTHR